MLCTCLTSPSCIICLKYMWQFMVVKLNICMSAWWALKPFDINKIPNSLSWTTQRATSHFPQYFWHIAGTLTKLLQREAHLAIAGWNRLCDMQKVNCLAITMNCWGSLTKQQLQEWNGGVKDKQGSRKPAFNFKVSEAGKMQTSSFMWSSSLQTNLVQTPM